MEELNKHQYLEVTRLIDKRFEDLNARFKNFEENNDQFIKRVNTEFTVLAFNLQKRVTVLEEWVYKLKTWMYVIGTIATFIGLSSYDGILTLFSKLRKIK